MSMMCGEYRLASAVASRMKRRRKSPRSPAGGEDLDGDPAVELAVHGREHDAHAAATQCPGDLVPAGKVAHLGELSHLSRSTPASGPSAPGPPQEGRTGHSASPRSPSALRLREPRDPRR